MKVAVRRWLLRVARHFRDARFYYQLLETKNKS